MRIIAEKDAESHWAAWWQDTPNEKSYSGSVLGAVARLLLRSPGRHVAASDLTTDALACDSAHIEMVVEGWERVGR